MFSFWMLSSSLYLCLYQDLKAVELVAVIEIRYSLKNKLPIKGFSKSSCQISASEILSRNWDFS